MELKRLISSEIVRKLKKKQEREREMAEEALEVFDGRAFLTEKEFLDKLGEIIRKKNREKAAKKIREKLLKGWDDVHLEIKAMPFCLLQDQATRVFHCLNCQNCPITGKCVACMSRGITHSLVDREAVWFLMRSGVKMWY